MGNTSLGEMSMSDRGRYPRRNNASARVTTRLGAILLLSASPPFRPKIYNAHEDLQKSLSGLRSAHLGPTYGAMTPFILLKIHAKIEKGPVGAFFIRLKQNILRN